MATLNCGSARAHIASVSREDVVRRFRYLPYFAGPKVGVPSQIDPRINVSTVSLSVPSNEFSSFSWSPRSDEMQYARSHYWQ